MGILDEDVASVRERADIVAVASQFMQLKRVGRRWLGLCPFHGEKTPSFSINAERGLWYCFGCQAHGDTIQLVQDLQHTDFVGAVEWLAGQTGVTLRYTDKGQGESRRKRTALTEIVGRAVDWYHQQLLTGSDAGSARAYLRQRGFDGDAVRRYRLGWAPDGWDRLARHLGVTDRQLADSGLGFVNRAGKQQDFFRGRVLFPIFDPQDTPIGFGGRILPGATGPKYRNTAQTPLYDKSKVLYGLNWAKDEVVKTDEVVVCEGYTDVIGFARAGVPRAVATCGTALTEEHVRLLKRFARKVVLAFDPDGAGDAAAERFYEWEQRHELEVTVADLPAGEDPGDLAGRDPDRLRAAVTEAKPFLGFRVSRALEARSTATPEGRARAAEAALTVIREHPSELVRDQYLMQVADRCQLDVERLRVSLRSRSAPTVRPEGPASRRTRRATGDRPETEALRLAVDGERGADVLPLLHDVLFADDLHAAAFRALREADGDVHAAVASTDPGAAELLQRLAAEDPSGEPIDVRRHLLRLEGQREVERLRRQIRSAVDPDAEAVALNPLIAWLLTRLDSIRLDARPGREEEDQLLSWLAERAEERA